MVRKQHEIKRSNLTTTTKTLKGQIKKIKTTKRNSYPDAMNDFQEKDKKSFLTIKRKGLL